MKDFISLHELSAEEVQKILDLAKDLKAKQKSGQPHEYLKGKTLAMIFEKPSTRTRVSFEVGMWQLGGHTINLAAEDIQPGMREPWADIGRTLSRYVDGIMMRTFGHEKVVELAKYASVPVTNGLTDLMHPCQAISDLFTILEKKGRLNGIKLAYIGDGNNVCHSLIHGAAKVGLELVVASPKGYEPDKKIVKEALEDGGSIKLTNDPKIAAKDADVIYTDVWASMGQEKEAKKRAKAFKNYQVNSKLVKLAKEDVIIMHCLPAHRGEEITAEVIDGPHSVVFDQAENRLHVQKAILTMLMGGKA